MGWKWTWVAVTSLYLAGCGVAGVDDLDLEDPPADDGGVSRDGSSNTDGSVVTDAGVMDASPPPTGLEIGTGETGFEPLGQGGVSVYEGPQGGGAFYGFHIFLGVRIDSRFSPTEAQLQYSITRKSDGFELSSASYRYDLMPMGDGSYGAWGMRGLINDCCKAEKQDVVLRVALTDRNGKTAVDERTVRVTNECISIMWAQDYCQ